MKSLGLHNGIGLQGRYGFMSDFRSMSETEARLRIQILYHLFDVREFQFYDWAASYSQPTDGDLWADAFSRSREVSLFTLRTFIDEIHRLGGRAWAYVQALGAEEADLTSLKPHVFRLIDSQGKAYNHADRFPCYFANSYWACFMVHRWAPGIAELGFDGVHWDTLGALAEDYTAESKGIADFIEQAAQLLPAFHLLQTLNFVSLAWWDSSLISQKLCFPYAEVWNRSEEQRYYQFIKSGPLEGRRGVIAYYPSQDLPLGWTEAENMQARWNEAEQHGLSYLVLGDNLRRLHNEYFPNNRGLELQDIRTLRQKNGDCSLAQAG